MTASGKIVPRAPLASMAVALVMLVVGAGGSTLAAADLRGAGIEGLRADLRAVRARLEGAPRASVYDLKQLRRRLAEQRVDTPDDPRLERLAIERRQAQWRAERVLRADRAPLAAARDRLPTPDELRAPIDLDIGGATLPIGTGKRFLLIQSGLRAAGAALDRGRPAAAAARLAAADAALQALKRDWPGDPNLIALEADVTALAGRLAAQGHEG